MKPAAALSLILLAAACARTEDASVRPAESNDSYSAVEQVRDPTADDREPALGEWREGLQDDQPALEFGPAGTAPLVAIGCGEGGGFILQRPGAVPQGTAQTLTVAVGGQTRQLAVAGATGGAPAQRATLAAGDPLIEMLASSQTPITLRFGDGTALVLPQTPLIARYARSCAGGFPRTAAGEGNGAATAEAAPASNETNAASGR